MPYQRSTSTPEEKLERLVERLIESLDGMQKRLELVALIALAQGDAAALVGATSIQLPNPATNSTPVILAAATKMPIIARVRIAGYQQGGAFLSNSSAGTADSSSRAPDALSDGEAKTYYLPSGSRLFARAQKTGGASLAWVSVVSLSEVRLA